MSWKVLLVIGTALIIIVSWTAIHGRASLPAIDQDTEMLVIRKIGHQLLLQAGDSTSRILPVEQLANKEYLIKFATPFTFITDSLVSTVRQVVAAHGLPSSYLVKVVSCAPSAKVTYGFQVFKDSSRNIVACHHRRQEKDCYNIRIRFTETKAAGMDPFSNGLLTGSLVAILISLLFRALYIRKRRTGITIESPEPQNIQPDLPLEEVKQETPASTGIAIGNLLFFQESQQLVAGSSIISLTAKEAKLLLVFANAQEKVIDRDQLLKEVWEDEGVIVGRSLDMFVSKLRKKLQADPRVSILNVHGKGYKLVIGQMAC